MLRIALCLITLMVPISAFGADWYTGAHQQAPSEDWIVAVDGSVDVTTQASYFGDLAVTAAVNGRLTESGFRGRIEGLAGRYQYFATDISQTVQGSQESGSALLGYQWVAPNLSFMAFLGADVRNNRLSVYDPENPVNGTSVGAKGQLELFSRPTSNTFVSGIVSFSTNKTAYFARLRGGYSIGYNLFVGPEILALGDAFFSQERIGIALTGLQAGPMRFAFAAGYLHDRIRGDGGYGTIDTRVGF